MRNNQPVTQLETVIPEGVFIYSRTDLKGRITEVNQAFADISGFPPAEMIGEPHNLIRHPDMPAEAFTDMWSNLKAGRPWKGLVKNRRKDGGFYWVVANASPVRENGQIVGYQSVRTPPTREEISAAEAAYRRLRNGTQSICVRDGRIAAKHSPLVDRLISHQTRLIGFACIAALTSLANLLFSASATPWIEKVGTGMAIVTLTCSLYMLLFYLPRAMKRLNTVLGFLDQVLTTGDLRAVLRPTKNDIIGTIAARTDTLVSSMRATLQIFEDSTREVADTVALLNRSVEEQTSAASTQSATTASAAAGVEEMTVSIGEVARHAATTVEVVHQTGQTAKHGADLSVKATETIQALSSTVSKSAETVEQLGKRTEEIGKIAGVINEIADQTNLLALNAAIEAARAGEQGRGFSVVADEVRKLAERTATATREITQTIHQIQDDTALAVENMRQSAEQMGTSVTLVTNAHEALVAINVEMDNTVHRVTEISHSSAEQSSAMTVMAQGVERIARLTEENLATAEITQTSSQTVKTNVERMRKAVMLYRI